jgi:uncharacterized membrane protein YdjX (TVP38/TMEM64 family)
LKRLWLTTFGILAFFLFLFLLFEALGITALANPTPWLARGGWLAATISVGLLVADVLLPVPSSLIMIANGAAFGVPLGALISLLGSMGAMTVGFAIGRRGGALFERLVPPAERKRFAPLVHRWGALIILLTRPIPLLSETVAVLAGASPIGYARALLAAFAGALPAAVIYALTGAVAQDFKSSTLMFGAVLLVAGSFYLIGRCVNYYLETKSARKHRETPQSIANN